MKSVKIVIILTIVGLVSGGTLAVVFSYANPLIQENKRLATNEAVKTVVPGASTVKPERRKGVQIYRGLDSDGRLKGYAFPAEFSGFQGKIRIMIGVDPDFTKITGLDVLENIETPGLGNKIVDESWRSGFNGLNAGEGMSLVKNQTADRSANEVEAITGATISSQAVVDGANAELVKVREAVGAK